MEPKFKVGSNGAVAVSEEKDYIVTEARISVIGNVCDFLRSGIFPK